MWHVALPPMAGPCGQSVWQGTHGKAHMAWAKNDTPSVRVCQYGTVGNGGSVLRSLAVRTLSGALHVPTCHGCPGAAPLKPSTKDTAVVWSMLLKAEATVRAMARVVPRLMTPAAANCVTGAAGQLALRFKLQLKVREPTCVGLWAVGVLSMRSHLRSERRAS